MTEAQIDRMVPLYWLAEQTGEDALEIDRVSEREQAARVTHERLGILPTIGCEVEVSWAALHPDLISQYFSDLDPSKTYSTMSQMIRDLPAARREEFVAHRKEVDAANNERYLKTIEIGIPRGKDPYWEFANAPAYAWSTLAKEVDLLMDAQLIPLETQHPMHITLGGVSTKGGGPQIILPGLELLGVAPERIEGATKCTSYSWAQRESSKGGVRERQTYNIGLGQKIATEFRTLTTAKHEDHQTMLRAAQMLGAVLLCRRSACDEQDAAVIEIGGLWSEYRDIMVELWNSNDLPSDDSWGVPSVNPDVWLAWAECLARKTQIGTQEQQAVQAIRGIVDAAENVLEEM